MIASNPLLHVSFLLASLCSFALALNNTTSSTASLISFKSRPLPSTVYVTSTPGQSTVQSVTVVTIPSYQNTTTSPASPTSEPTTPAILTSSAITSFTSSAPTTSPTVLHNLSPVLEFEAVPILVAAVAFVVGVGIVC